MQGLVAVESHGQVCMSGPLGDFAGVSVDAAGQVYSQNKSAAFKSVDIGKQAETQ